MTLRLGFGNWFDKREDPDRMRREEERRYRDLGYFIRSNNARCVETLQCAQGHACIDGRCQPINNEEGQGTGDSFGTYVRGCYINNGDCNSGSRSCSLEPTCGRGSGKTYCCGGRLYYSYNSATNSLEPRCAYDIIKKTCSAWCEGYQALNGEVSSMCKDRPGCDPECEECTFGECRQRTSNVPCYCEGGRKCGECKACNSDPNSPNFGSCVSTQETRDRCRQCLEVKSHTCCGAEVGPVKKCGPPGSVDNLRAQLKSELQSRCRSKCGSEECEKKNFKTYCSDTTGLPGPDLNCPSGLVCRQSGSLSIAGVNCVFVEEKDVSDCPYKPGRWVWKGEINNARIGVPTREYGASFIQGDPNDPNSPSDPGCEDGGCYPAFYAPSTHFSGSFTPLGIQSPWAEEIVVSAVQDGCSGATFACQLALFNSSGVGIRILSPNQYCNCYDSNGVVNPIGDPNTNSNQGCYNVGTWTYEGPS